MLLLCKSPYQQPSYEDSFVASLQCLSAAFIRSCEVYTLLAGIFVASIPYRELFLKQALTICLPGSSFIIWFVF